MLALLHAMKFKRVSLAGLVLVQPVHSSTVLFECLLALGSKVLRMSASDVVKGKENIGYHCGLGITYLGKPGVRGTRMSSSLRLQLFYNGEPCAGIHYLCIMTASPNSSNMQKYMYPRRRIRKTSFRAPSFDNKVPLSTPNYGLGWRPKGSVSAPSVNLFVHNHNVPIRL